jgi:hypothetical protein
MLITAAVGTVLVPVSYNPDKLEARFFLADEHDNRFSVVTKGSSAYETVRALERSGERAFVAGVGRSKMVVRKGYMTEFVASVVIPAMMINQQLAETMAQQMFVGRLISMVENGKA